MIGPSFEALKRSRVWIEWTETGDELVAVVKTPELRFFLASLDELPVLRRSVEELLSQWLAATLGALDQEIERIGGAH